MASHPELQAEQSYVDHAYRCLESARERAFELRRLTTVGPGGTHQARIESEVVEDTIRARLAQLDLGDLALVFGRIDPEGAEERFYIGRVAVADEEQEPVVVDWRAPVAEPFYRATGRSPMGLARRRHFASRGRRLLGIEDEWFGEEAAGGGGGVVGADALRAAMERPRSGRLGDIVATIQAEQDEIIRSELGGVLVVQGGPGTGKTVVALHRAAYLLYTHRFPLEDQGVLVVGPNRLYLRYIGQVLPSLDEAGVELALLGDLVPEPIVDERAEPLAELVKGDLRMIEVLAKAVRDRQRGLREDLVVDLGLRRLRCRAEASRRIVRGARAHSRIHNAGRRMVERALFEELARGRDELEPDQIRERLGDDPRVRAALEWMWPVLTPAELLRDLLGSPALTRLAAADRLTEAERAALYRPREERTWRAADVALLEEARRLLGPRPGRGRRARDEADAARTYGHIVVDEAQDLSPMQLRMLAQRSLGGSMTVVGDMAQATGAWAPSTWDQVLAHLPSRRPHRVRELTVGYRTPSSILTLANRVLAVAAPGLRLPASLREGDAEPEVVAVAPENRTDRVAAVALAERQAVGEGNVAVVAPDSLVGELAVALARAGVVRPDAVHHGLEDQVSLVPVRWVKGLELDSVVLVEPARVLAEEPQGLRALYVALTRATRRLTVVHAEALPEPMILREETA